MLRRPKPEPAAAVDPGELVLCVEAFRLGNVGALIERGQYLRRDHSAVAGFPQFFRALIRLDEEV